MGSDRVDKYIPRIMEPSLKNMASWFPVVSLTGPRQSGKSTLAKQVFPDFQYVNLEDPQLRAAALEDPISFIRNRDYHLIIDEAQYAPDLFSVIQVVADERGEAGQYVLTGSQNFLMMKSISQSLAGRVGILKLLPLSFCELQDSGSKSVDVDRFMYEGGYPRLHDSEIPPSVYFQSYVDTYVERDVAALLDVRNKTAFRKTLRICAHNVGKLLNLTALSNAADVSAATLKSWLSILESSYLVFRLQPYHSNAKKRFTKASKLYFYDTGLLCSLLQIDSVSQLVEHPLFGAIFENLIVAETMKRYFNKAQTPELYFYRDDSKREIDLLDLTDPQKPKAIEVKSSRTYHDKYAKSLNSICNEIGIAAEDRSVVARVESSYRTKDCNVVSAEDYLKEAAFPSMISTNP